MSRRVMVEGVGRDAVEVLKDGALCGLLSDEGPIEGNPYPAEGR